MTNMLWKTITTVCFIVILPFGLHPAFAADSDVDGLENPDDNCIRVANGPLLGTCTAGDTLGETCTTDGECGTGGFCSMNQEDADTDGFGDACDYCAGPGLYDTDEDGFCDGEDTCPTVYNPAQNDNVCANSIQMFTHFDTFEGNWYEIGRQVGSSYPDNIIEFASIFTIVLGAMGPPGLTPQSYYTSIESLIPQSIKDHMQGMAAGLTEVRPMSYAVAWNMVLTANMAIELLNFPDPPGCTAFAVSSEAGTFLCHNTDANKMAKNLTVAMYWKPNNGDNSYITIDPPVWSDVSFGLNDKGLGITLNAGRPNTNAAVGMPPHFMVRYVMEHASTLAEAVDLFQDYLDTPGNSYGTSGSMLLLVDFKDSSMARIQVRSEVIDVSYGEEVKPGVNYVYATNHFLGDFNPDPEYYYESSWERLARLLEIFPTYETYDLQACLDIMTDHGDGEANNNSISRDGSSSGTVFSTIFTPENVYYTVQRPHEYLETYPGPVVLNYCGDGDDLELDADADGVVDCLDNCPEPAASNSDQTDMDCDGVGDICDICPDTYNPNQEDHYPQPEGNGLGDACECQGNFDCDGDCDGTDAATFKVDFGRSQFANPCANGNQCHGDFDCDGDCDGTDAATFKGDFGRSTFNNPCPLCEVGDWCSYEP